MKKSFFGLILIAIMVFSIVTANIIHFGRAQSGTSVSGIIGGNVTWTQASSPYTLTGNVLVYNGANLTIQSGATVNLGSYYIEVNGTLQAIGNSANPITFNGGQITFTLYGTSWNQSTGTGSIIENAFISSEISIDDGVLLNNNTIIGAISASSQFYNGIQYNGNPVISNNTIKGGIAIGPEGFADILGNTITGSGISISTWWLDSETLIEGNLIVNNTNGIFTTQWVGSNNSPTIQNNTITNNTIGINLSSPSGDVCFNNIYGNIQYNIENANGNSLNATYNWWGTTDPQAINQTIYDTKNDFNDGTVNFSPFLSAPNTQAPTYVAASASSGGSITPNGYVRVNCGGSQAFNISPNTGYHIADVLVNGTSVGAVSTYNVQNVNGATTILATFAPNSTPTPSPTPSPSLATTPTSRPSPTPTAAPYTTSTIQATTSNGGKVDLTINGDIARSQISNLTLATNQTSQSTTLSFTVTGASGTTGFGNITLPKNDVPYGTSPTIYIDGQPAQSQGYTQDSNNYYVWFTTHFSSHQISITFTSTSPTATPTSHGSQSSSLSEIIIATAVSVAVVAAVLISLMLIINGRKAKAKQQ